MLQACDSFATLRCPYVGCEMIAWSDAIWHGDGVHAGKDLLRAGAGRVRHAIWRI